MINSSYLSSGLQCPNDYHYFSGFYVSDGSIVCLGFKNSLVHICLCYLLVRITRISLMVFKCYRLAFSLWISFSMIIQFVLSHHIHFSGFDETLLICQTVFIENIVASPIRASSYIDSHFSSFFMTLLIHSK